MVMSPSQYIQCTCLLLLLTEGQSRPPSDHKKRFQLEAVKEEILDYLGLTGPPSVREKLSPEELKKMYQLYEMRMNKVRGNTSSDDSLRNQASTVHQLVSKFKPTWKNKTRTRGEADNHVQMYSLIFSRSSFINKKMNVISAKLKLHQHLFHKLKLNARGLKVISVYKVLKHRHILLGSKAFTAPGSANLDLSLPVQHWMASSDEHLKLALEFPPHAFMFLKTKTTDDEDDASSTILEIESKVNVQKSQQLRERRDISSDADCKSNDKRCCRKSLSVSFEEIGWSDWVIAPKSYTMYFCVGSCPHNYKASSMHTQIKAKMHHLSNGATPAPSCVPAEYEPMVLMHYTSEGKLTMTTFEDIIVKQCYCA
ncbi:growth/differentiation factor 15 [Protopterus annectens]|uniref:growth/differentiation factor 15 n=1 Tax=Protopterus annectens TaxID=7888 RepID=UPI001CFAF716|nr:growth/differentiation factor 15 [Protopterus annectens]